MNEFLPVSRAELDARGIEQLDYIIVTGDAYVDHPSFGTAIISRVIEAQGFTIGVISQPDWRSERDFTKLGRPKICLSGEFRKYRLYGSSLHGRKKSPEFRRLYARRSGRETPGPGCDGLLQKSSGKFMGIFLSSSGGWKPPSDGLLIMITGTMRSIRPSWWIPAPTC